MRDLVVSPAMGVSTLEPGVCGVGARIAPPFMEATDASRLVCVVVVSYQEYSLTRKGSDSLGLKVESLALHVRERREK